MASKVEITNTVKKYIVANFLFGNENEIIADDDSFIEKGIIDSTGIMELIEFVEQTFGITMDDKELIPENLDSLNNLSRFILSKS